MASNRNQHLRYRYGICLNDKCEKCKSKEIQKITVRKDLLCEECGKPLRECPPPKNFSQKYGKLVGIGVAALVIIGGVLTVFLLPSKTDPSEPAPAVADSVKVDTIVPMVPPRADSVASEALNDSLRAKAYADSIRLAKADSILQANEAALNANDDSTNTAAPRQKPDEQVTSSKPSTGNTSSTHRLSYGSWNGKMKNGQPHGTGTMTYSTSHTIDSRDTKGRVAQPGEYIVGEWDNGHLVQGRWFKKDGTKEAVIIGKAG